MLDTVRSCPNMCGVCGGEKTTVPTSNVMTSSLLTTQIPTTIIPTTLIPTTIIPTRVQLTTESLIITSNPTSVQPLTTQQRNCKNLSVLDPITNTCDCMLSHLLLQGVFFYLAGFMSKKIRKSNHFFMSDILIESLLKRKFSGYKQKFIFFQCGRHQPK
jgi:hypothetical protein